MSADTVKTQPFIPMPNQNSLFTEFHCCLAVAIEPVRRGVAAEQGRERDPEFNVELFIVSEL